MRFRQKALALLTVSLMILSNCFTAIPIAHASGALDWPSQEFRFRQDETDLFSPFLDGKGYVGVKCDGMSAYTVTGDTPLWNQSGNTQYKYSDFTNQHLLYVSVKGGEHFYLYRVSDGAQVVPSGDSPVYSISVSYPGGFPSVQVSLAAGQPEQGNGISHICLFFSGNLIPPGKITIKKAFDGIGDSDKEFSFTVTGPGNNGTEHTVKVHAGDLNGVTINVPYGTYYIKEITSSGYKFVGFQVLPNDSGTDMETPDTLRLIVGDEGVHDTEYTVTCTNTKLYGAITLQKAFQGINTNTNPADTYDVTVDGIEGTSYHQTVHLKADGTPETLSDLPYGGKFKLTEAGKNGYQLVDISGAGLLDSDEFQIDESLPSITATVTNKQLGSANIKKVVSNYNGAMPPFKVRLSGTLNGEIIFNQVIDVPANDTSGINVPNLPYGHYTITEELGTTPGFRNLSITPADGFDINDNIKTAAIEVKNQAIGSIQIVKLDSRSTPGHEIPVEGTHFEVYYMSGDQKVIVPLDNNATGANGTLLVPGLVAGRTYYAREIEPAPGYNNYYAIREFLIIVPGSVATSQAFVNDPVGKITVEKRDRKTGALLGGFQFGLYETQSDANNDTNRRATLTTALSGPELGTATSGELILTGANTSFWVKELPLSANSNYLADGAAHEVVITFAGRLNPFIITIFNNPVIRIIINKFDAATVINGNYGAATKLSGAKFGVFLDEDCDEQFGDDLTTGTDPLGTVTVVLQVGGEYPSTYYVKEISPPPGYLLDTTLEPLTVSYGENDLPGKVVTLNFANVRNVGSIIIKKVDSLIPTTTLAGAQFTLYSDSGLTVKVRDAVTTGSNGIARFDNLEPGTYWLKETKAPANYKLITGGILVTVTGGVTEPLPLLIRNQYDPPDIQTGMMDWNILIIGGIALLAGGVLLLLARKRRVKAKEL